MGLFSQGRKESSSQVVPPAELVRLAVVGRAAFADGQYVDVSGFYLPGFLAAGSPAPASVPFDAFVDRLVDDLVRSADASGEWALAGALYVARIFLDHKQHRIRSFVNWLTVRLPSWPPQGSQVQ